MSAYESELRTRLVRDGVLPPRSGSFKPSLTLAMSSFEKAVFWKLHADYEQCGPVHSRERILPGTLFSFCGGLGLHHYQGHDPYPAVRRRSSATRTGDSAPESPRLGA
jgi:hypothetical protein